MLDSGSAQRVIERLSTYTPHHADRSAIESAAVYSGGGGGIQPFNPPADNYLFARIVPTNSIDILIEIAGQNNTPHAVGIGSTRLLASGIEYMVPIPDACKMFIAGLSDTATFQLTWCK